jgi:hypothetical protein
VIWRFLRFEWLVYYGAGVDVSIIAPGVPPDIISWVDDIIASGVGLPSIAPGVPLSIIPAGVAVSSIISLVGVIVAGDGDTIIAGVGIASPAVGVLVGEVFPDPLPHAASNTEKTNAKPTKALLFLIFIPP